MRKKKLTAATNLPLTTDEAKAHCRVTFADDDTLIEQLIHAATDEVETRCQRTLCQTTWALTLDAFPEGGIKLPMPPILSVSSIVYFDSTGAQLTLNPADYIVDTASEPGWVWLAPGKTWPATQDRINAVTVTYTAGYLAGGTAQQQRDAVPKDLRAWLLIRVATLYENREYISLASAQFPLTALDTLWQHHRVIEA